MGVRRRCLDFGAAGCAGYTTRGSRCGRCAARRKRVRNADRPIARAVVAASPVCSCEGCGLHNGRCRSTEDLTADHVVPLAKGGTNRGPRRTLCRACNSSKGQR